jgi:hypothetical protein
MGEPTLPDQWLQHARQGHFDRAWQVSERILERHRAQPDYSLPRHFQSVWTGASLQGRRVLVRCYHGLGDTIQFIRYAPMLKAVAREVIVWGQPELLELLRTVEGIDRLLPLHDGSPGVDYDVDVEVMELAFVFRSTLDTLPRHVPYLSADPAALPGEAPRAGLVWRAGEWETERSMTFDALRPLLAMHRFTWCSLQQGRRSHEAHPALIDIGVADIGAAARRIKSLDLLITVDSMPAHLAGALGVPVWTLLKKDADWRWMEERDDSPWYPTMRLFRQREERNWAGVVDRVAAALDALT